MDRRCRNALIIKKYAFILMTVYFDLRNPFTSLTCIIIDTLLNVFFSFFFFQKKQKATHTQESNDIHGTSGGKGGGRDFTSCISSARRVETQQIKY